MREQVPDYRTTPEDLKKAREQHDLKLKKGTSKKELDALMKRLKKGDPDKDEVKRIV